MEYGLKKKSNESFSSPINKLKSTKKETNQDGENSEYKILD